MTALLKLCGPLPKEKSADTESQPWPGLYDLMEIESCVIHEIQWPVLGEYRANITR